MLEDWANDRYTESTTVASTSSIKFYEEYDLSDFYSNRGKGLTLCGVKQNKSNTLHFPLFFKWYVQNPIRKL